MTNSTQIKNDIQTTASSHVFEVMQYLTTPINTDMDSDEISEPEPTEEETEELLDDD